MEEEELGGDFDPELEFVRGRKALDAQRLRQSTESYLDSIEQQRGSQPKPEPQDESSLAPVGRAALREIVGVIETPMQMVGGARDAAQEVLEGIDSVAGWLNDNVADMSALDTGIKLDLPEVPEAESITGDVVRNISQFLTGVIPAIKAVRGVSGGVAASRTGKIVQAEAAAAISSATVFDPHEERLSNLIESFPALRNPVTEYLSAQPDDTEAEGRMKNALEGLALGPLVEGVAAGVRALKANRKAKGIEPEREVGDLADEPLVQGLGDPDGPLVLRETPAQRVEGTPEQGVEFQTRQADPTSRVHLDEPLPFRMNWARFSSSADVETAVGDVAQAYRGQIDEARRGVVRDEELAKLADDLGVTPEIMLRREPGEALNAENIVARRRILEAATNDLVAMAREARGSTDEAVQYQFRKMLDIHAGLQAQFQGAASEAGRALRALRIPAGSRESQIEEIRRTLMNEG